MKHHHSHTLAALILMLGALLAATPGHAHSFGQTYTLPVPLSLYLYASAAVLLSTFVLFAVFAKQPFASAMEPDSTTASPAQRPNRMLRGVAMALLALCIATGLWGSRNPYGNFNMTFFWVIFVLGYAYLTALFGNGYSRHHPWPTLPAKCALLSYPRWLGYWPACVLYLIFIWIELFAPATPKTLALTLLAYSAITLCGCLLFGSRSWFQYGEFFAVFFRLIGTMSPRRINGARRYQSLIDGRASAGSELLFIMILLSSTAFDGLHETRFWNQIFWVDITPHLKALTGDNPFAAYPQLRKIFLTYQSAALLMLPFLYLGAFLLFISLGRKIAGSRHTLMFSAQHFAYSLLPIALVYHVSHYYPLLQSQGIKIISLASDPFGWGWNLFGTADWFRAPILPDIKTVWHVQLMLIVAGHIAGVYIAHLQAIRLYGDQHKATLSQIPMLALMILFTMAGLWILSLPMGS